MPTWPQYLAAIYLALEAVLTVWNNARDRRIEHPVIMIMVRWLIIAIAVATLHEGGFW